jgi:transposase-like protein
MVKGKGELHSDAGQDCPAQEPFEASTEITVNGERLRIIQATPTELAAITQCLKERAESAPAGARIGRASALVRSGVKFAAVMLLATGVGVGLGDGNVFDDVGCSVAQQPGRVSADPVQTEEHPDGKASSSDDGAGVSVPDGPSLGDEVGGLPIFDCRLPIEKIAGRTADILQAILHQTDLIEGLVRGQKKFLQMGLPGMSPALPESVAGEVFAVVKELEGNSRWRKAPIIRVFRLYCVECLSVKNVAQQCGCSRSLVFERLKELRMKLGRNPAELRQFSSQFERIEDSIRDPQARKIYPTGSVGGDGPDESE